MGDFQSHERRNWLLHWCYVRSDFASCEKLCKDALAQSKGLSLYPLTINALLLRQQGKVQEALELFENCALIRPSVETLKHMAKCYFLLGRHQDAVDVYEQCVKAHPKDWESHHGLGVCYAKLGQPEQAQQALTTAIQIRPVENSYTELGQLFRKSGDLAGAIKIYRKGVDLFPGSATLCSELALLEMYNKDTQQAYDRLAVALTRQPQRPDALLITANILQGYGDLDAALSKYKLVGSQRPHSATLWNNIAMCFFAKKKYVAAISCLKRAQYYGPFHWQVLYNLSLVHLTMQQGASAFHFAQAAIMLGLASHNKEALSQLYQVSALALDNVRDVENAHRAYQQAIMLNPKDPLIAINMAVSMYRNGKSEDRVMEALQAFQDSQPDNEALIHMANTIRLGLVERDGEEKSVDTQED
ncbi:Bardet-Biedl syndrome 4 protein homolog [Galendromus occidentalis]|uniref:Bardet-Biedl syndrome 4 protein homolog n=1 Tax=Galendromus occidentalis TaxID=34638 RepID=A0AAJ6QRS5_9ACAR|nr:Bardet-Biedl syndrome 4 protein homolog [Galendromus occidentalis]